MWLERVGNGGGGGERIGTGGERGGLGREGKGCEENAVFGSNSLFNWLCASHISKERSSFSLCLNQFVGIPPN